MKRLLAIAIAATIALSLSLTSASAAINPGSPCKKLAQEKLSSGAKLTCVKSGGKLTWSMDAASYELTKLKAYNEIRSRADSGNLDNVSLVYHVSPHFPKDLL